MKPEHPYDTLWTNCHLATMASGDYGIIRDGAIAVDAGRIIWIGPQADLPSQATDIAKTVRDGQGCWVTPGLVDCHTHLVYAGNRAGEFEQRLQGASYQEIARQGGGILSTVRAVRETGEEELYRQSLPRLQAMLTDGVTTVEIKSGYGLDTANELKLLRVISRLRDELPMRIVPTFLGAHTVPPEFRDNPDAYVDLVISEMLPLVAEQKLATAVDVFCEKIGFTLEQTEKIFVAADALGLRVKMHAEQLSDSKGAVLTAGFKGLSVDHLEYIAPADIPLLANSGTVAVLLPGAFYYLHETRKPPVAELRKAGVPMAISTDANPGTSPVLSLRIIINMACVLFGLTPAEALAAATINGARALGLEGEIGTLAIGKQADLLFWEIASPADLAYQLGGRPLRRLLIGGQEIMMGG